MAALLQARPFAGFHENFCLKRWNIWTKLGGNGVWPFWPFLRDSKAVGAPNRWSRTHRSMIGYARECRGPHRRLLPTARCLRSACRRAPQTFAHVGVCDQRVCACLRLLPTAGVSDQHFGLTLRLLLTAGVCGQHFSVT